ncbi:alpha-amylase family glycosyl hydrolase [Agaribacterium haliotis]|uniref:alpha-amylase family glycosyl hydrolase n=1 Tax=Agaribacterium haliotis TaxID=2013869 RepID=UPI000BB541B2|nr:alpha-amylase family glycosyl hydrolase [Agaribacterium haliotis]
MTVSLQNELKFIVESHLNFIYEDRDNTALMRELIDIMGLSEDCQKPAFHESHWDEKDSYLITYGDSIKEHGKKPLQSLLEFYRGELSPFIKGIHILPFFPYSSDDGFSVIDYVQVNDSLGEWEDIEAIAKECTLMGDLVVNHCSSRSRWFDNFKQRKHPGLDYFFEADPEDDLSMVVRPRTSPLLREVETLDGKKHVWCTFSHDQVDLNFSNPKVLAEITRIIKFYLDKGILTFRLDAVAFVWKEVGNSSINHPKTHEIVRLLRSLIEHHSPNAIIITETNIPNHENLSYFGNANEAHAVYNFSLPPLILHAMVTGNSQHLKYWQMSMPPAQLGTFYFNFLSSHDGIGLRPAEGLLNEEDIGTVVNAMQQFGARINWRSAANGVSKPYEINITYFDAMAGTSKGPDQWQVQRFICAHAIMMSLEGVPAIYIQSLIGGQNWYEGVELSGQNRAINRYKWDRQLLGEKLNDNNSHHSKVFNQMKTLLELRSRQSAFHPNATQFTLHLGDQVFGFWRQSLKRDQSIFCIHNISDEKISIPLSSINLISLDSWTDLVSGTRYDDLHQDLELAPYAFVWLSNKVA